MKSFTCPKNEVISFFRKDFCALGFEISEIRLTSIRVSVLDPSEKGSKRVKNAKHVLYKNISVLYLNLNQY